MSAPREAVFIGLGSNLDRPVRQVRSGLRALAEDLQATSLVAASPLYRSAPLGPPGQPDYVNAVAELRTALVPEALLDALQGIEQRHGRRRSVRWGPRTLDLDILLYGDRRIASGRLSIPHPGLKQRAFVLVPLCDLAPGLVLPDGTRVAELCRRGLRETLRPVDTDTDGDSDDARSGRP